MIFRIPKMRNKISPMIYPEFRIHSILFAYRSLICCAIHYYSKNPIYPMMVSIATMIGADITTHYLKPSDQDSTMRSMPFPQNISEKNQRLISYFHSTMQVGATLYMLENMDTAFAPLCSIQMAAFLMTLVRKNIIKSVHWHLIYSALLLTNFISIFSSSIGCVFIRIILYKLFIYMRFDYR